MVLRVYSSDEEQDAGGPPSASIAEIPLGHGNKKVTINVTNGLAWDNLFATSLGRAPVDERVPLTRQAEKFSVGTWTFSLDEAYAGRALEVRSTETGEVRLLDLETLPLEEGEELGSFAGYAMAFVWAVMLAVEPDQGAGGDLSAYLTLDEECFRTEEPELSAAAIVDAFERWLQTTELREISLYINIQLADTLSPVFSKAALKYYRRGLVETYLSELRPPDLSERTRYLPSMIAVLYASIDSQGTIQQKFRVALETFEASLRVLFACVRSEVPGRSRADRLAALTKSLGKAPRRWAHMLSNSKSNRTALLNFFRRPASCCEKSTLTK